MVIEEHKDATDEDYELYAMVYTYRRTDAGWESSSGAGGFPWPGGRSASAAAGLAEREVFFEGGTYGSDRWSCRLVHGFVGAAGRWVEVHAESEVDRRGIPPSGGFVAVHQGNSPVTVRIFDEHEQLLGRWDL